MTPECFHDLQHHASMLAPWECCGLVVNDRYFPCRNDAEGEDEFRIHPWDWIAAEKQGRIQAVCHSHPGSTARPGEADITGCNRTGLPWYIVGSDGLWRLDPASYPLEGRPFVWGWSDCYSLVRDAVGGLPDFARTDETDAPRYADLYQSLGWRRVQSAQPGDIVLMDVQGQHAGVIVAGGKILHHLAGRLSMRESYAGLWQRQTRMVLRRGE